MPAYDAAPWSATARMTSLNSWWIKNFMNKFIVAFAFISLAIAGTASAGNGGNSGGNPKNNGTWEAASAASQSAPLFIWKEGKLVRNLNHEKPHSDVTGKVAKTQ